MSNFASLIHIVKNLAKISTISKASTSGASCTEVFGLANTSTNLIAHNKQIKHNHKLGSNYAQFIFIVFLLAK